MPGSQGAVGFDEGHVARDTDVPVFRPVPVGDRRVVQQVRTVFMSGK